MFSSWIGKSTRELLEVLSTWMSDQLWVMRGLSENNTKKKTRCLLLHFYISHSASSFHSKFESSSVPFTLDHLYVFWLNLVHVKVFHNVRALEQILM